MTAAATGTAIVATPFHTHPPVCRAFGIEVRHRTPILELCRRLVDAGYGGQSMTVVNGVTGRPVMNVSSIAEVAELDVVETERGPRFKRYRPSRATESGAKGGVGDAYTGETGPADVPTPEPAATAGAAPTPGLRA